MVVWCPYSHRGAKLLGRHRGCGGGGEGGGIRKLRVQGIGLVGCKLICSRRAIRGRGLEGRPLLCAVIHPAPNTHRHMISSWCTGRTVRAAHALDAMSSESKCATYLLWMSLIAKGCARRRAASLSGAGTFASCRAISPSNTYCLSSTANTPVRSLRVRQQPCPNS